MHSGVGFAIEIKPEWTRVKSIDASSTPASIHMKVLNYHKFHNDWHNSHSLVTTEPINVTSAAIPTAPNIVPATMCIYITTLTAPKVAVVVVSSDTVAEVLTRGQNVTGTSWKTALALDVKPSDLIGLIKEKRDDRAHITILPHHNLMHRDRVLEDDHTLEYIYYRIFHREILLLKFSSHVGYKAMCPVRTKGPNYVSLERALIEGVVQTNIDLTEKELQACMDIGTQEFYIPTFIAGFPIAPTTVTPVYTNTTTHLHMRSGIGKAIKTAQDYVDLVPPKNEVLLSCYNVYKILSIERTTVPAVIHMEVLNYHDYHYL
ncbi:hypothetical protein Pelo_200 [Pelomyxa schiedti]|nr:hypothetical protein Pelo_200 [Pelomyxa schiedti]